MRAIIAQKATQKHNAFVAIISENKVEEFGDKKNSSFKKFKSKSEDEINIGTSPRPLHGRSLKNNLETNRSAERFSSNIILS